MLIDTHSHVNFNAFEKDSIEVIKRALDKNIWLINVGSKYETSKKAVEIANNYQKGVYASVGLHPIYATQDLIKIKTDPEEGGFVIKEQEFNKEKYQELINLGKVVAVGEVGLDYYYKPKTKTKFNLFKEKQKQILDQQIKLAQENNLPIIFHCRMAHEDLLEILSDYQLKGVIHCFTGNMSQMKKYLEMGFNIGLNGIIFKLDLKDIIKQIPLEKILIETDCPYLTPPQVKQWRNEPIFLEHIVQEIAEIKKINYSEVVNQTTENARKLFNI